MDYYKRQFDILYQYMKKIEKSRPPFEEYINMMSDLCREMMDVERCIFWIYDDENEKIYSQSSNYVKSLSISSCYGIIADVIKTGERRIVNDCELDPNYNPEIDLLLGISNRSSMYIPLKHSNNTVYGAIQIINKNNGADFSERDLDMMLFVALYCEEALTSYFFEEELIETQNDIVFLLAELGESRSQETAMHVRRVSAMAEHLANLLGLHPRDSYMIKLASPLHDLGKVGIKDAILTKPGKLTDEEYDEMKRHTTIGHKILENMHRKLLKAADIIVHQHHERYDGQGYPNGLFGENIHIYARITSICDVFDALANKRVYKEAWSKQKVMAEFEAQRARQFDPNFVDVFLQHIDEFYEILSQYPDA